MWALDPRQGGFGHPGQNARHVHVPLSMSRYRRHGEWLAGRVAAGTERRRHGTAAPLRRRTVPRLRRPAHRQSRDGPAAAGGIVGRRPAYPIVDGRTAPSSLKSAPGPCLRNSDRALRQIKARSTGMPHACRRAHFPLSLPSHGAAGARAPRSAGAARPRLRRALLPRVRRHASRQSAHRQADERGERRAARECAMSRRDHAGSVACHATVRDMIAA